MKPEQIIEVLEYLLFDYNVDKAQKKEALTEALSLISKVKELEEQKKLWSHTAQFRRVELLQERIEEFEDSQKTLSDVEIEEVIRNHRIDCAIAFKGVESDKVLASSLSGRVGKK